ncbi:uncharacterized protein VNE69_04101 [Vairimorpha necatrix]|uniref:EF-hand domain-containing protein n=1 Tax=Vairimorpha necatrix TaxID=6039 RepID=A0AAX4JBD2_9MICR
MNKQNLTNLLSLFMSQYITKQELTKYFSMGDKFSEEEIINLLRLLPFDSSDGINLHEFVDFLTKADDMVCLTIKPKETSEEKTSVFGKIGRYLYNFRHTLRPMAKILRLKDRIERSVKVAIVWIKRRNKTKHVLEV